MNERAKGSYVQRPALEIDVDDQSRFDCALLGAHAELFGRRKRRSIFQINTSHLSSNMNFAKVEQMQ
jgi:hypothetical protein